LEELEQLRDENEADLEHLKSLETHYEEQKSAYKVGDDREHCIASILSNHLASCTSRRSRTEGAQEAGDFQRWY
jgi:hypothetical protein